MNIWKRIREVFSRRQDKVPNRLLEGDGRDTLIPLDQIVPNPSQPRRLFSDEKLCTLGESIKKRGILQPVLVSPVSVSPPRYKVSAGERRFRAAKLIGLSSIPAIVKDASDEEMRILALLENLQRVDLTVVEKTRALGELFNDLHSMEQIAAELGISQRIVERYIRIYRVVYSTPTLASVFERQGEDIDFKTAETMATLLEISSGSSESSAKFLDMVNAEGVKSAIKSFIELTGGKKSGRATELFNIVTRKDELIFTARHAIHTEITAEDKRAIQHGLKKFFRRLKKREEISA